MVELVDLLKQKKLLKSWKKSSLKILVIIGSKRYLPKIKDELYSSIIGQPGFTSEAVNILKLKTVGSNLIH